MFNTWLDYKEYVARKKEKERESEKWGWRYCDIVLVGWDSYHLVSLLVYFSSTGKVSRFLQLLISIRMLPFQAHCMKKYLYFMRSPRFTCDECACAKVTVNRSRPFTLKCHQLLYSEYLLVALFEFLVVHSTDDSLSNRIFHSCNFLQQVTNHQREQRAVSFSVVAEKIRFRVFVMALLVLPCIFRNPYGETCTYDDSTKEQKHTNATLCWIYSNT